MRFVFSNMGNYKGCLLKMARGNGIGRKMTDFLKLLITLFKSSEEWDNRMALFPLYLLNNKMN